MQAAADRLRGARRRRRGVTGRSADSRSVVAAGACVHSAPRSSPSSQAVRMRRVDAVTARTRRCRPTPRPPGRHRRPRALAADRRSSGCCSPSLTSSGSCSGRLAAFTVAFVVWLAVLFERRAPRTLHGFLASLHPLRDTPHRVPPLAANPYPGLHRPAGLSGRRRDRPARAQGRLGRRVPPRARDARAPPLAALAGARSRWRGRDLARGWAACSPRVALLGWFACLARGRMPRGMRDLRRVLHRLRGADVRRTPARHGPLPVLRPGALRTGGAPRASGRDRRRRRPAAAAPARPLPALLVLPHLSGSALVDRGLVRRRRSRGWPRSSSGVCRGRCTASWRRSSAPRRTCPRSLYMVGGRSRASPAREGGYPIDLTIEPAGAAAAPGRVRSASCSRAGALLIASAYGGVAPRRRRPRLVRRRSSRAACRRGCAISARPRDPLHDADLRVPPPRHRPLPVLAPVPRGDDRSSNWRSIGPEHPWTAPGCPA